MVVDPAIKELVVPEVVVVLDLQSLSITHWQQWLEVEVVVVAQESSLAEDPTRAILGPMVQLLVVTGKTKMVMVAVVEVVVVATTAVWADLFMAEMMALIVAKTATV